MQQLPAGDASDEGDAGDVRGFAPGGHVVGPDGSDTVPLQLDEGEAIVDRHGRVICRVVGGVLVPPEVEIVVDVEGFSRRLREQLGRLEDGEP